MIDSTFQQIAPGSFARAAEQMLDEVAPHVVHLASLEYAKPRFVIDAARKRGARVVVQPWVHNFFCEQGYDFREGEACGRCAGGAFHRALVNRCIRDIPGGVLHSVSRVLLRRSVLRADAVYSTNSHLDARLVEYGIPRERIVRGPLPFDRDRIPSLSCTDGDEFVFHGQAKAIKGFHLLGRVVRACPDARFGLFPLGATLVGREEAGLAPPVPDHVAFDGEIRWESGLADRLARARGVLLPSLWPSTTEYALLEALGWGKPVVAFAVGVNKEILRHQENAMVASPGDVEAFVAAVRDLNQSVSLRRRIGEGARRLFLELTDEQVLQRALAAAYGIRAG
jgi:glycosyltransferase involved in cell wall biosynthesis